MMEIKLWAALCALLLVNFGSADHDNGHTAAPNASESGGGGGAAPPTGSVLTPSLSYTTTKPSLDGSDTNSSQEVSGSLSGNTTTEGGNEPKTVNGTDAGSDKNQTGQSPPQPSVPPSVTHTPTSHTSLTSTTTGPTSAAHVDTADVSPTTTPPTNTSDQNALNHTAPPKILSPTSAPTPEPTKSQATTTTTTTSPTTTTTTQSSSTSSTSSSQKSNSEPPTLTPPPSTSQPDGRPETSSADHKNSSTTSQAVAHANDPSQLNVGGDTTMVHDSPTLDPLLAGLVSAFIITAVIITLLLFLKLRRRDNRPEFRRLQDLPMDDMMEDTPLSMYSY